MVWSCTKTDLHEKLDELGWRPVAVITTRLAGAAGEEADEEVLAEDGAHGAGGRPRHLLHQQRNHRLVDRHRHVHLNRKYEAVIWDVIMFLQNSLTL